MAYYIIPTKEQIKKDKDFHGQTWEQVYRDYICDTCHEQLKPGDKYFVISGNPFVVRHILCDEDFLKS